MTEPTDARPEAQPGAAPDPRAEPESDERLLLVGRVAWLEATRRVGRTVRHELANVFMGISLFVSQLEGEAPEGATSAEDVEAVGDLMARGVRLLDLLRDLGREAPEAEVVPLDPAGVLAGIASVLTAVALPCSLSADALEPVVVRASRRGIEEAVMALVVDAREAAGDEGGEIRLSAGPLDIEPGDPRGLPAGGYAAIVLEAPAPLSTAAEEPGASGTPPGEQIQRPVPLPGAPGFGLALAAASARARGGGLRAEPAPGGRAVVTLLIPEAGPRRRLGDPFAEPAEDTGGLRGG